MGVRLGIEEYASYKLEAKVSYGGLKYNEENFKNQRRIIENNSNEICRYCWQRRISCSKSQCNSIIRLSEIVLIMTIFNQL